MRDAQRSKQAANVRSGGVYGGNRGDISYPRLRWRRFKEPGDVSGQSVGTRHLGTEFRFDGGGSRSVAILVRRPFDVLDE